MKRSVFSSVTRGIVAAGCVVLAGISMVACSKTGDYSNQGNGNGNAAGLMVFNLSDKNSVNISLSGSNLLTQSLGYSIYTGGYLSVGAGTYSIRSYDAAGGGTTLAEKTDSFATGRYYTLVAAGAAGTYRNVLVRDNYDNLQANSGKAYVRFVNAVPDSAAPVVTVSAAGQVIATDPAAGFGKVSEFVAVSDGAVTVSASNGGTIQTNLNFTTKSPEVYTVLLKGIPGSSDTTRKVGFSYIRNGSLQ